MKPEVRHIIIAGTVPLFFIFILYIIKIWEVGMGWEFIQLGIYPFKMKGLLGIFTHPLIHSNFAHLAANTLPLFFLSWCLYYFYHGLASSLFFILWVSCGILTFLIGKPGWHIGASGLIYGLAFFLFFSGVLRKHIPLMAISLLIAFLYGGLVWNMFPFFTPENTSWEGHLSGAVSGILCAFAFKHYGPQRPEHFADEAEEEEKEEPMDYRGEEMETIDDNEEKNEKKEEDVEEEESNPCNRW